MRLEIPTASSLRESSGIESGSRTEVSADVLAWTIMDGDRSMIPMPPSNLPVSLPFISIKVRWIRLPVLTSMPDILERSLPEENKIIRSFHNTVLPQLWRDYKT
jgi:hypothetical protein